MVHKTATEGRDEARSAAVPNPFIVGMAYDTVFFLFAPAIALGLSWWSFAYAPGLFDRFIVVWIHAHLFAVFFRSHANPDIFKLHPLRFTLAPALVALAVISSEWMLATASVVATWWDVYHSGQQTFGLGRIYDKKFGNDMNEGRNLDQLLNLVMYSGPILAGATLMAHVNDFEDFSRVDSVFFTSIPAKVQGVQGTLSLVVIALSLMALVAYIDGYRRLVQQGYRVSPLKLLLFATTGLTSIVAWGFNSFGDAFFIMNFFHAWQYFALVWAVEGTGLTKRVRADGFRGGRYVVLLCCAVIVSIYGWIVLSVNWDTLVRLTIVVSLMHFWYDGFVWSVRKGQV